jgi:TIR domain/SIR2-like domain
VRNILEAMNCILRDVEGDGDGKLTTPELIRGFHQMVGRDLGDHFDAIPGRFRTDERVVGPYKCPRGEDVIPLVERLCQWLAQEFGFATRIVEPRRAGETSEPTLLRACVHERDRSASCPEMNGLDDEFWEMLLDRIANGEVVPIVGPGAVTFGAGDELLYPWLTQRLPVELSPPLVLATPPRSLPDVVDAQRAAGRPIERIYRQLHKIVEDPGLRPGPTLAALAAIDGFKLFISTTFDPLLSRAVESHSPGGRPEMRRGAMSLREACPDLPQELARLDHRFVYQILGRAQPARDFVVWDDDTLHFLLSLNEKLPPLTRLTEALKESHLLVLGLSFADWLLRFFVQIVKRRRLSELADRDLYVFEQLETTEREKVVVYFSRLTKQIRILPTDPLKFVKELHDRWKEKMPAAARDPFNETRAHRERHRSKGCIFVSYASDDLEVARYVVNQLQSAGCLVWFDKEQIQPGENWDDVLRDAVEQRCGLFVSIMSDNSATRLEGYNLLERKLAAKRRERFADTTVFYLPLRVDEGEPLIPMNEPRGTRALQAVRRPGGHLDVAFIGYVREKQRQNCASLGYPLPPP